MARFTKTKTTIPVSTTQLVQNQSANNTSQNQETTQQETISVSYEQLRMQGKEIETIKKAIKNEEEKIAYLKNKIQERRDDGKASPGSEGRLQESKNRLKQYKDEYNNLLVRLGPEQFSASKKAAPKNYNLERGKGKKQDLVFQRVNQSNRFQNQKIMDAEAKEQSKTKPGIYRLSTGEVIVSSLTTGTYTNEQGKTYTVREAIGTKKDGGKIFAELDKGKTYTGFNLFDKQTQENLKLVAPFYSSAGSLYASATPVNVSTATELNYTPAPEISKTKGLRGLGERTIAAGEKDIERSLEYGKRYEQLATSPYKPTGILGKISRNQQLGTLKFLGAANYISGIGTQVSGNIYLSASNVPRNLVLLGTGALFGGSMKGFERLSTRQGVLGVSGKIGNVAMKGAGVALTGYYAYSTGKQISNVPKDDPKQYAGQVGKIVGGAISDAGFFGLGTQTAYSAIPKYKGETTGVPIGDIKFSSSSKTNFKTTANDLTGMSTRIGESTLLSRRTTKLTYNEKLAGVKGWLGKEAKTTLTIRPSGYVRRVQVSEYGKVVTTQKPSSKGSTTQVFDKGSLYRTFKTGSIRPASSFTITSDLGASVSTAKNVKSDVLLQQTQNFGEVGVIQGGYSGTLYTSGTGRSVSIGQSSSTGRFAKYTGLLEKQGKRFGVDTGSKVLDTSLGVTRVVAGKRSRALFENRIESNNQPRVQLGSKRDGLTLFERNIDIVKKGDVSSFGDLRSSTRGVLRTETRFNAGFQSQKGVTRVVSATVSKPFQQRVSFSIPSLASLSKSKSILVVAPYVRQKNSLITDTFQIPKTTTLTSTKTNTVTSTRTRTNVLSRSAITSISKQTSLTTTKTKLTTTGINLVGLGIPSLTFINVPGITKNPPTTPGFGFGIDGFGGGIRGYGTSKSKNKYSVSLETIEGIRVGGRLSVSKTPKFGLLGFETRKARVKR